MNTEELIEKLKKDTATLSFDERCDRMKEIYKSNMKEILKSLQEMKPEDAKMPNKKDIIEFMVQEDNAYFLCQCANQDFEVYKVIKMWEFLEIENNLKIN